MTFPTFCTRYFDGAPIETALRAAHTAGSSTATVAWAPKTSRLRIKAACAARASKEKNGTDTTAAVDTTWDVEERRGLRHVIQTLTLVGGVVNVSVVDARLHGRFDEHGVEIAAISGATHTDCVKALKRFAACEPIHRSCSSAKMIKNATLLPREVESFADPRRGAGVTFTRLPRPADGCSNEGPD